MRPTRYPMLSPSSRLASLSLAALVLGACGHSQVQSSTPYAGALDENEDLGDPRDDIVAAPEPSIDEILAEDGTQEMTLDGLDANDAPTDMVQAPPKRPAMGSMMPSVLTGPSGAAPSG